MNGIPFLRVFFNAPLPSLILRHLFFSAGDARVMGQASVSVQHLQDGAEEESPGRAGRAELLRCYK